MTDTKSPTTLTGGLAVLIVLGIVVAANILVGQARGLRADFTEEKLYTLSDGTREMLGELERDVTIKFYYSKSSKQMPTFLKQYALRIEDLLGEFELHSDGRVLLESYDTKPDSDAEEWAQKYGLTGQGVGLIGGDNLYMGLVAVSGTREAAIPFLAPAAEPQLEYLVSRLVYEVVQSEKPTIGVMSPLDVMGAQPAMPMQGMRPPESDPWVVISELESLYNVQEVPPAAASIPEEIDALVLVHPKQLSEQTLYALDQFVMRGGRLVAFLDAVSITEQETSPQANQFAFMRGGSELNRLTETWGITFAQDKIAVDPASATQVGTGQGRAERSPAWLTLRQARLNDDEIATSALESLMMPFAGFFSGEAAEGLTQHILVTTSDDGGSVDTFMAMGSGSQVLQNMQAAGAKTLALRLTGSFESAFPDGRPAAAGEEGEEEEAEMEEDEHLASSREKGVVILVADSDVLYDRFCVQELNFFGQRLRQPINDNLNFVLNLVEQVSGNDALIGLRSRGTYQRPFTRVLEMEKEAQAKYQAEEERLQAKLQEAQQRLNELQAAKQGEQQFILSPEQEAELKRFQEERFKTQRELKEVRKELRREIEQLGYLLKAVNMAGIPLLVAVFGIVRGVKRRSASA